jgi:acetylornithine deacetylase/succinyl-diaminopimelate desuccinylase-like protein
MAAVARLSQDPIDHSIMHTTCVATRLSAGHANNALPQTAQANVNCRIVPGHSTEEIRQELEKVLADPKISVKEVGGIGGVTNRKSYAPPPLRPDVFQPLEKVVESMWPGLPVVPDMATGASDGVYTNAAGRGDILRFRRGHRPRRYPRSRKRRTGPGGCFYRAVDFYYRFLKALTSQ